MSAELKGFITWFIYFLNLLYVRYNYVKFHHYKPPPLICDQHRKDPSWAIQTYNSFDTSLIYPFSSERLYTRQAKMILRAHSRKKNYVCIKQSLWALTGIIFPCIYSHISHWFLLFLLWTVKYRLGIRRFHYRLALNSFYCYR